MKRALKHPFTYFLLIYLALIVFVNLYTMFASDFFAEKYGWLLFVASKHENPTLEVTYGKILMLSLLCTTPITLLSFVYEIYKDGLRKFLVALLVMATIALIVFFYYKSGPLFKQIPESTKMIVEPDENDPTGGNILVGIIDNLFGWIPRFGENFRNIYMWYSSPIIYAVVSWVMIYAVIFKDDHPILQIFLTILIFGAFFIGLPILVFLLGGVVSLIIEILLFGIVGFIIFALFKNATYDSSPKYQTSDGHVLTKNFGDEYVDDRGYHYDKIDSNTFREK